jgi:hypothetical protein
MKFFKTMLLTLIAASLLFAGWRLLHGTGRKQPMVSEPPESMPQSIQQNAALSAEVPSSVTKTDADVSASLITGSSETDVPWTSRTPAAKRVRKMEIDPAWMTPEPLLKSGDIIELALFDDAVFKARISNVTRYPNGSVGMTAHLEGGTTQGTVFLSYCDGQMRASIEVLGGADYYLRYNPETGNHYAIEIDREQTIVRECGGDVMIPPQNDARGDSPVPETASDPVAQADAPAGSTVVDVMIVYTPKALADEGGISGMNNNITIAMQKANISHTNSDTQVYLNLVHSAQTTYTESGDDETDLNRLTNISDGYMDEVHSLRDAYGADLVCLFSDTATVGGIGWLLTEPGGRADHAFCLAWSGQTDTGYTLVHEWGHNMGCSHSKTQAVQPWSTSYRLRSYSAGWQWNDTKSSYDGYCTVMTYEDFDDDGIREYTRVGYFSNPSISYTGNSTNPTGHASDGDNARAIREMKAVYAAYRSPPIPPPVTSAVTNYPYSESFENGYGYWSYTEGQIEWTRQTGGTPSLETGPSGAASGSYYMYTEATSHDLLTARLRAVFNFSSLSAPEIGFSYHMYGADMGALHLEASTNGTVWNTLWSRSGNQGNQWLSTNISLQSYSGRTNIHLRFSGTTPDFSSLGDMALDLITVQQGTAGNNDLDNDGLPNDWETQYFGGPTNANPSATASNGINTVLQCYIAGLNPTNPASVFGITVLCQPPAGTLLRWNSASGRIYSVYAASNLLNSFQTLETNLVYPQAGYTDAVYNAGRFYQVGVRLAP